MSENHINEFLDYITFPRTFEKYNWYKPLLTIVVTLIAYVIFQGIFGIIFGAIYWQDFISTIFYGGYESLNSSDALVYWWKKSLKNLMQVLQVFMKESIPIIIIPT